MTRSRNCHYIEINPVILLIRYTSLRSLLQLDIGKSCHLMSWKVILTIHQVIYLKALTRGLCFHSDLTTMLYNKGGKLLHYPLFFQHPPSPNPQPSLHWFSWKSKWGESWEGEVQFDYFGKVTWRQMIVLHHTHRQLPDSEWLWTAF